MIWAAPWAWGLALAALLPIVAHLWSRKRPAAVLFPTLRFLRAASPVSRRLRRVKEWPLLLLRLAVVTAICAAAAGPTVLSSWRQETWRARLHRVVVVDAAVAARAGARVAEEQRSATAVTVFGPAPISDLLDEAIAEVARHERRMRTELVVVWDGSRASITPGDLEDVPRPTGVRLVPVETSPRPRSSAPDGAHPLQVTIRSEASDQPARDRLLARLRRLHMPAGTSTVEVLWPGSPAPAPRGSGPSSPVVRRAIDEVADDVRVRDAAERSVRDRRAPDQGDGRTDGRWLARARDGAPLLRGWTDGERVVLALDAAPASPLAWWSVVAALESIVRPWTLATDDDHWSPSELAQAQREPAHPPASPLPGGLDTRAAWAVALALLLIEEWLRRRDRRGPVAEVTDAA